MYSWKQRRLLRKSSSKSCRGPGPDRIKRCHSKELLLIISSSLLKDLRRDRHRRIRKKSSVEMDLFAERFPIQFFGHVPEKKKVVSIPVRFVESETTTGEAVSIETNRDLDEWRAAALKIQKVFRGHLVRKNVRTVRSIDAEIVGVARILSDSADLLRSSEKERLRLGEALMRLLLKLDSVRGVREYRRKITRRAVSLQEKIDSIASAGDPCPADAPETDAPDVSSPSNRYHGEIGDQGVELHEEGEGLADAAGGAEDRVLPLRERGF